MKRGSTHRDLIRSVAGKIRQHKTVKTAAGALFPNGARTRTAVRALTIRWPKLLTGKPMCRDAYTRRRCIVGVDGSVHGKPSRDRRQGNARHKDALPIGLADQSRRRLGAYLRDHRHGGERIGGSDPRPHAGHLYWEDYERWLSAEPIRGKGFGCSCPKQCGCGRSQQAGKRSLLHP
jgi:hypothetical protein